MRFKKAETSEELYDVYRLRYKVYCLERGYEAKEDHPFGIETDEYDIFSLHILAYVDEKAVGTARLILPNPFGLPVERFCNINIRDFCPDPDKTAEISRLAVSYDAVNNKNSCKKLVTMGLITEIHTIIRQLKINYVVSAMTKSLERMLSTAGLCFKQAGAPVQYHGIRAPYFADIDEITENLFCFNKKLYNLLDLSALRMNEYAPVVMER
ncbi:MAG: GNAT family N-acyltransferase [Dissulfurispiraceae bacterium]|jgi:N-acyl-L-homoserine lactone synthetase|nr:GNAT family N-acyltransferase [Dissulfurispiraceae bacterium]